jgi:RNA polymerase sigma-70 factor (ECF subfamily)
MDDASAWRGADGGLSRVSKRPTEGDGPLIERVASGDRRALGEVYARFGEALFGYLLAITKDRQLAEELLQDTLVAVWQNAGTFRGRSSAKTWVFGVARRRAHDALRRRALPLAEGGELDAAPAVESGPEEALLADARREGLEALIGRLSPVHREVLTLVFFHGLSYGEAAEVLGVRVGTVKSRLHNAKRAVRALFEDPKERG